MKKILNILFVCLLGLGLVACGNKSSNDIDDSSKNDDTTVITTQSVDITLDNWKNYFKIITKEDQKINSVGDIEDVYIRNYLVLKDDYAFSEEEFTNLDIQYSYDTEKRWYQINEESSEISWGDVESVYTNQSNSISVSSGANVYPFDINGSYSSGGQGDNRYIIAKINLEVTNIQGTLYYAQN